MNLAKLIHICDLCIECQLCHLCDNSICKNMISFNKPIINQLKTNLNTPSLNNDITKSYAYLIYFDKENEQIIKPNEYIYFNKIESSTNDILHNKDTITLTTCGIYKLDLILSINPKLNSSLDINDDNMICIIVNDAIKEQNTFCASNYNLITYYQLYASIIIDNANISKINIQNIGNTAIILNKIINNKFINSATLIITKI